MIKKFFVKLTSWSQTRQHKEWEKMMASKGKEIDMLAKGLEQDREAMRKFEASRNSPIDRHSKHSDEDIGTTTRNHDKAA